MNAQALLEHVESVIAHVEQEFDKEASCAIIFFAGEWSKLKELATAARAEVTPVGESAATSAPAAPATPTTPEAPLPADHPSLLQRAAAAVGLIDTPAAEKTATDQQPLV